MSNFDVQSSSSSKWLPSPRLGLWTRLEKLHEELHLAPPTATLTIEQLEQEIERLEQEAARQVK